MNITVISILVFASVVIIGILTILKAKTAEKDGNRIPQRQEMGKGIGIGIAIGMPIGLAIGIALDNIAIGIAIGPALGVGLGTAIGANLEAKRKAQSDEDIAEAEAIARKSSIIGIATLGLLLILLLVFFMLRR